jgi:RNA polymerase sigma-70 factor (ECF subfamily)
MNEEKLIEAAQNGDVHAFNQLVRKYQRSAYNVAYRILSSSDRASDATQDAFVSAFRAIDGFRGGSFKAWIMRIVTNACYDILRRKKRQREDSLDEMVAEMPEHSTVLIDEQEEPESFALRQELGATLQKALAILPDEQRISIVLADVEGYSYQEIADVTGVALGTVKSRISRGRTALRDYLLTQRELLPAQYRLSNEPT